MALNFPDSPTLNQIYTDTTSGFSYQWDGTVWQSFTPSSSSQIRIVDNISGSFNGSTDTFSLAISGVSLTPLNPQQLRVVLGGIVQEPGVDYIVSGSNIIFTTPPSGGLGCSIVSLGPAIPISVIDDGSVTPPKLSTGGPSWNTDGDVVITGTGTTALLVNGNARVTGILTATGFVGNLTGTATGLTGTPDITVGNLTATGNVSIGGTLTYEDVTNVDSVGLITARSGIRVTGGTVVVGSGVTVSSGGINVVGIVTATTLSKTTLADYADKINALGNTGTSATVDLSNGNFVTATLTGDCTFTFTTGIGTGAQAFTLFLTNDATPSRTITWPVTVKWSNGSAPVRTETANKTDVYSFFTFDNGSNWYGTLSIYNYS